MSVLIMKNVSNEGPGTIKDYLDATGVDYRIVEMSAEDPPLTGGADTLVIMGGPMSVHDTALYPYLDREIDLTRNFIAAGKKVLGICLGAQIMAKALGARIYTGAEKEIGWYDIELQESGSIDPLMSRLATHPQTGIFGKYLKVFQLHGETFDIPEGATKIARSALYPNQAFKYGTSCYAFQFHIEVSKEMIYEWLEHEDVDMNKINRETESFYEDYAGRAWNFYREYFQG